MHLSSKADFIHHCWEMFELTDRFSLEMIRSEIEQIMLEYNLSYLRGHIETTVNSTEKKYARDYFFDELDTVENKTDLRMVLNNNIRFDHARWYAPKAVMTVAEYENQYR